MLILLSVVFRNIEFEVLFDWTTLLFFEIPWDSICMVKDFSDAVDFCLISLATGFDGLGLSTIPKDGLWLSRLDNDGLSVTGNDFSKVVFL